MADAKAMQTIKTVLMSTQGATGEMLSEGIIHALRDRPEERHELQVTLLKMVTQVLSSTRTTAKVEAEGALQQKVDEAKKQLDVRKAAVATATQALSSAEETALAQKAKLDALRLQVTSEDQEHERVAAADQEKAKEVGEMKEKRREVADLLTAMQEKGNGEAISKYLLETRMPPAELPLIAALRSVLEKEPSERIGFDTEAIKHLQAFLENKVAEWDAQVAVITADKANIHAEALGAWAIHQVAGENVQEAITELEKVDSAVVAAQQTLEEANVTELQEENGLSHCMSELLLAGDRASQCSAALETLERLAAGQDIVQEVPLMVTGEAAGAMEVDSEPAAGLDVEMGTAITA